MSKKKIEKIKIREGVEEIVSNHEGNTSEGAIYWEEKWVGGKKVPTNYGGYKTVGGKEVSAGEAFYKELVQFIVSEKGKSYKRGYQEGLEVANKHTEYWDTTDEVLNELDKLEKK